MMFCLGGQLAGLPLLAKRVFDVPLWQLAALGVTGSLGYALSCAAMGWLVGRANRLSVAVFGAAFYSGVIIFAVWAESLLHLVAIVAAGSVGMALFWPMIEAAIAGGAKGRTLSRRMGFFNICWSVGDVLGIITAGMLYDLWPRLPVVMASAGAACVTLCVVAAKLSKELQEDLEGAIDDANDPIEVAPEVNSRFLRAAWVGNFVSSGVISVIRSLFADTATDIFRMSGTLYGLAIGTINVCRTLSFLVLRHWPHWHYRKGIYLGGSSMLAVALGVFVAAAFMPHTLGMVMVFVSFAAVGVSTGLSYYSSIFYSVHNDEATESNTRLHEVVIGAGGAVAISGAFLANHITLQAASSLAFLGAFAPLTPFAVCVLAVLAQVGVCRAIIDGGGHTLEGPAQSGYPIESKDADA